jgi:ABC-type uncharacterized transport system involved in gliding motility auxiliary subunit
MTYVAGAQAFEPASGPYQRPKPAEGARIVVVANSYCAANGLLARAPGDQLLVVNSVAWLDQRALPPATIPGQDLDFRLLKQWNPRIQRVVLLLCTVAMPVLAIVLGAFVWFMRRK